MNRADPQPTSTKEKILVVIGDKKPYHKHAERYQVKKISKQQMKVYRDEWVRIANLF